MTGVKWTQADHRQIACELRSLGVNVSSKTVGRLLETARLLVAGEPSRSCAVPSEDQDTQFACIAELRARFAAGGHPIISVDTKKRELVKGLLQKRRAGLEPRADSRQSMTSVPNRTASQSPTASTICSRTAGQCSFTSYNTPDFAVCHREVVANGRTATYPAARDLAILADAGGRMAIGVGVGSGFETRIFNRQHRLTITIRPVHPSGIQWSTVCSARSARTGRAGLSTATKPSSNTSARPPPLPVCEYAHNLIRRRYPKGVKITGERMQALGRYKGPDSTPNGTTPSDRLENGNLFCRRP